MRVTNGIPLGCPLLLPVDIVNSVQTLKAPATQVATLILTLTMNSVQTLKASLPHNSGRKPQPHPTPATWLQLHAPRFNHGFCFVRVSIIGVQALGLRLVIKRLLVAASTAICVRCDRGGFTPLQVACPIQIELGQRFAFSVVPVRDTSGPY